MATIKLNNGHSMPQVGYGVWKVDNDTCADLVYNAIKVGYRLFDGTCDYGNERAAGQGVARAIKDGLVKRSDLFIVSKLWNSFHDPERVAPICRKQLADWASTTYLDAPEPDRRDGDRDPPQPIRRNDAFQPQSRGAIWDKIDKHKSNFDLFVIHFPISLKYVDPSVRYPPGWNDENDKVTPGNATLESTYHAMEGWVEQGLAKSIGVSNYSGGSMLDMLRYAKIRPATLQIEHHPYLVQQDLLDLCMNERIAVTAYSSFGPQSFRDIGMELGNNTPLLFDHATVVKIAKSHGKTPAQVLLRWATQRGLAVIPKSGSEQRLKQNLDVTSFDLSQQDLKEISALDRQLRFNNPLNYGVPIPIFA